MKLLIVEDEIYSRKSLVKQVQALDAAKTMIILEAADGKAALELVKRERPELVLSDIQMPFMNGLELLKETRRLLPDTRVIMISGYAEFEFAQQALNLGAIGYLLKPISDESLCDCFSRFLTENSGRSAAVQEKPGDPLAICLINAVNENKLDDAYVMQQSFSRIFVPFRVVTITFLQGDRPEQENFLQGLNKVLNSALDMDFRILPLSYLRFEIVFKESSRMTAMLRYLAEFLRGQGKKHCCGISAQQQHLSDFLTAHTQACYAEKYRLLEQQDIYSFDELRCKRTVRRVSFQEKEEFEFQIQQGKAEEAYRIASEKLLEMHEDSTLQIEAYETFLLRLQMAMDDHEKSTLDSLEQQWFPVQAYADFTDLLGDLKAQIYKVCDEISANRMGIDGNVSDQVFEYIQQNYSKDFSLKDLAKKVFYMNPSYLSYLIRKKTGKTYSSYLKEIRISHAKELLLDSHLPITEVAMLCGYNDPSQFIAIFKKETGMTPRRFREQPARPEADGGKSEEE